ncbi:UvrD-helicase domain-containing protein [Candidatus Saccharibacteria bacterium oral taxon 488]|nr:UvrD-helicase domain-containing protein [Candidatus Saccharibacteria bacterium oral taxon 488]
MTKLNNLGELLIRRMTDSEKRLIVELLPLFEANNIAEAGILFTENYPCNGYSDSFDRWYSMQIWKKYRGSVEQKLRQYDFTGTEKTLSELNVSKLHWASFWFDQRLQHYKEELLNEWKPSIEGRLQLYDFASAENILLKLGLTDMNWSKKRLHYYREKHLTELKSLIEKKLRQYNFTEAEGILSRSDLIDVTWFEQRLQYYKKKQFNELKVLIEDKLCQYDFIGADKISNALDRQSYETIKAKYVKQWFEKHVSEDGRSYVLDEQQVIAVLNDNKNTIVTARAGSGKTRTLVAKVVYLAAKYNIKPDELLVFVFNKKASDEINERLEKITVDGKQIFYNPEIATTFHAFARRIVYSICGENEKYGKILAEEKAYFIQAVIKTIPKRKVYQLFRSECFQIKRDKFASEQEYFEALRNSKYETLDGKVVKSEAEKIISDYLFEHGVAYYYENEYYLNSAYSICQKANRNRLYELKNKFKQESIKPDFYLKDYDIPWEHWAINGDESLSKIADINKCGIIGDYDEYKAKMIWKRWFYQKSWIDNGKPAGKYALQIKNMRPLIETTRNFENREEFEAKIEKILQEHGINKPKLPEEELIKKVWNSQVKRFSKMIMQFIDRAQQQFFDDILELRQRVEYFNGDDRTKVFLEIGLRCYFDYHNYLAGKLPKEKLITKITRNNKEGILDFRQYGIDFNLLLKRAIYIVNGGEHEDVESLLSLKKYILVDEYQDFSKLFLKMILSVRDVCPESKLFVVGDDWQAINRFAGSDTEYFKRFTDYFPEDSRKLEITTNYRCDRRIVENARTFMRNSLGENGNFSANSGYNGEVVLIDPTKTYIDYRDDKDNVYKKAMMVSEERDPSKAAVQYIKTVAEIIKGNKDKQKILLLHRNNDTSFWFIDLLAFYNRLCSAVVEKKFMHEDEFKEKVEILTMHRAKGLEADVVIILEADDGIIPMYHQDTHLFEIFGETEQIVLDDQKKLFYVAITRAKEKLYILHNSSEYNKNGFVEFCKSY